MKAILSTTLFLLSSLFFFVEAQDTRKLDDFNEIAISGDIEVSLVQGAGNSATVYAEGISPDDVTVYISGNTLKIQYLEGLIKGHGNIKVEVSYKAIDYLRASAGAQIYHAGVMNADTLRLRASSGCEVDIEINAQLLNARAVEGAVLTVSGTADAQDVIANTGGQYLGMDLECKRTEVTASTGGEAEVSAYERLDANANTGGEIMYKGQPEMKTTRSFIAGGIRQIQ